MSPVQTPAARRMAELLGAAAEEPLEEALRELPPYPTAAARTQARQALIRGYRLAWAHAIAACLTVLADEEAAQARTTKRAQQ